MSIRRDDKDMIAIVDFWCSESQLIKAGTVLPAKDPTVRRCRDFFAEASLQPSLDPERLRELERGLWAKTMTSNAG
jgi:hypothetical protein